MNVSYRLVALMEEKITASILKTNQFNKTIPHKFINVSDELPAAEVGPRVRLAKD